MRRSSADCRASGRPGTVWKRQRRWPLWASYALTKTWGLRLGINNVLDKDPPIAPAGNFSTCPTGICNGNTYAQVYDTLGRYIYMRASASF